MREQHPFTWRHVEATIMLLCLHWSLRYALSSRDLEEMMWERGLHVDHTRCIGESSATPLSWRNGVVLISKLVTTPGKWTRRPYKPRESGALSRAVASEGNTLALLLRATRDAQAAKPFFLKALGTSVRSVPQTHPLEKKAAQLPLPTAFKARNAVPRVINVDKNAAYSKAIAELKTSGSLSASVELRQGKDFNTLIEHDHRFIKRLTKPGMGFFSFNTAWKT